MGKKSLKGCYWSTTILMALAVYLSFSEDWYPNQLNLSYSEANPDFKNIKQH